MMVEILVLQLATFTVALIMLRRVSKMADGFADLTQALSDLASAVSDETAVIETALGVITSGTASGAEAEAAAQTIQGSIANMKTETQKVKDALNPPPPAGAAAKSS